MLCPRCRHPNRAQAKFCDECGAPVHLAPVTRAAAALPRDSTAPDIDRADRRQATVLFTDISGYTEQCARSDPEQVQALLGRFYAAMDGIVEAYGGRVFDRAGDAVMAVFGAPVAHGNDGERAVRAALEMHAVAAGLADCDGQPLRLHIGIASGEVVAAVIGAGGKSKYSVTGDTVNLAARLDALAGAGETLIADALHRSLARVVEARSLGEQSIKGLAVPVPVWQVTGLRAAALERTPLVGRDAELAQLLAALDAVRDSAQGLTIVLRGDAGIGKSRLLEEFRARAAARGFATAAGQVLDFGVGKGQDAVASVLRSVLGVAPLDPAADPAGDDAARHSAVRRALQCGAVASDEEVFINDLLDLRQPPALKRVFEAMDNASRTRRSGEALAAVLQRAARTRPLLLSLEDMHWASPDVLRLSAAMASATADSALIVLLTSRLDGDPMNAAWRAGVGAEAGAWQSIDLAPLRDEEAAQLARRLIEGSGRFVAQCIARAEGNPLFLEQLLRTQSEAASVPPTIQSLVLERVDRLAEPERSALQAAAVIGKRFSLDSLRAVVGRPGMACDALLAADLVRAEGGGFLFAHALIQEAVYASTLKSVRRDLHRKAAAWFVEVDDLGAAEPGLHVGQAGHAEPVLHAEHLDRADDPGAAQAYLSAATQENARFRHDAALRLSERGAKLAAATSNRAAACELALLRGEVLREMGRSPDSIAAFRAAADFATTDLQRCHAWLGVAAGNRITGAFDAAMAALNQAEPIAERLGLALETSKIHHLRGNLLFAQGKVAACDAEHQFALAHAVRAGNVECEAQALSGLGDAQYAQGRMHSALAYFQRCVGLCAGRHWVRIEAPNRCMTGHCLWYQNRLGSAIDEARRACDDAHRHGAVPVEVFAQTSLAQFLAEAGLNEEAEQACDHGLVLARAAGSRRYESTLLHWLAGIRLAQGQAEAARQLLDQALELARETGLGFIGAALFARLARAVADPHARAKALRDGAALLHGPGLAHGHLWFYRDAIEASIAADDWDTALRHADAFEAFAAAEPLPWATLLVARCRALHGVAALAAVGQGSARELVLHRLQRLRADVDAAGLGWALASIDAALARFAR